LRVPPDSGCDFRTARVARAEDRDCEEIAMKGLNQKKSDKKKPAKTMKEKRAEKQQKKAAKG
jgi:hypothetical protein